MGNLTLAIDDETLRAARIRALEDGTSVNAVVRTYLENYARNEAEDARAPLKRCFALADKSGASSGSGGRTWTRDELYDRWDRPPRT